MPSTRSRGVGSSTVVPARCLAGFANDGQTSAPTMQPAHRVLHDLLVETDDDGVTVAAAGRVARGLVAKLRGLLHITSGVGSADGARSPRLCRARPPRCGLVAPREPDDRAAGTPDDASTITRPSWPLAVRVTRPSSGRPALIVTYGAGRRLPRFSRGAGRLQASRDDSRTYVRVSAVEPDWEDGRR